MQSQRFSHLWTGGATTPEILLQLVQAELQCSVEEACVFVEQRVAASDSAGKEEVAAILTDDAAAECIPSSDKKEVENFVAEAKSNAADSEETKQVLRRVRTERRVAAAAGGGARDSASASGRSLQRLGAGSAAPAAGRQRRSVQFKSDKVWTEAAATALCPVPLGQRCRIFKDEFNGCWRLSYGKWLRARSWGKYGGDEECVRRLLQEAWGRHTSLTGEECPIQDLFSSPA